jgi:hypothetical protein
VSTWAREHAAELVAFAVILLAAVIGYWPT